MRYSFFMERLGPGQVIVHQVDDKPHHEHVAWHPTRAELAISDSGRLLWWRPLDEPKLWRTTEPYDLHWFGDTVAYELDGWIHVLIRPESDRGGFLAKLPAPADDFVRKRVGFSPDGKHVAWLEQKPPHVSTTSRHRLCVGRCEGEAVERIAVSTEFRVEAALPPRWSPQGNSIVASTSRGVRQWSFDVIGGLVALSPWFPDATPMPDLAFHRTGTLLAQRLARLSIATRPGSPRELSSAGSHVSVGGELVAVTYEHSCDLFDLDLEPVKTLTLPEDYLQSRWDFSADGRWLAASSSAGLRLYRIEVLDQESTEPLVAEDRLRQIDDRTAEILLAVRGLHSRHEDLVQLLQQLLEAAEHGDETAKTWVRHRLTAILDGVLGGLAYDYVKKLFGLGI